METYKERLQKMTIDELQEALQWIADRLRYAIVCNKPSNRADATAEHLILCEIARRQQATAC